MDEERDLVVFVDDAGDEKTMEVLDYFFYEGNEYAVLTEYDEDEEACECCEDECECCEHDEQDAFIMKVVPVEDDQEEFVPVEDELLLDKLIEFDLEQQEIEQAIDKVSEETQRKIDWTKLWGKKYPVLLLYPQQICIEDYAAPLRALLARLQEQAGYSPLDAMLVLKDILAKQWAQLPLGLPFCLPWLTISI